MNKTKPSYTPGPWSANQVQGEMPSAYRIRGVDQNEVALLFYGPSKANARLIAAAPDLLEAARQALDELPDTDPEESMAVDMLRAAIAKAEGGK